MKGPTVNFLEKRQCHPELGMFPSAFDQGIERACGTVKIPVPLELGVTLLNFYIYTFISRRDNFCTYCHWYALSKR